MKKLYDIDNGTFQDRFISINKNSDVKDDDYDLNNPIEMASISAIYNYLNNICLEDGTNIKYEKIGLTTNTDNRGKITNIRLDAPYKFSIKTYKETE